MNVNSEYLRCRVISPAHLSAEDNALLDEITTREVGNGEWIHYIGGGYLLRLTACTSPVLRLKEAGLSKEARRVIASLISSDALGILIFESGAPEVEGFTTYSW
ncbi:hypothetical protein F3J37_21390 [Pantoea sp. Al-1710]|uniref:DUF5983 domain-containing protein n=1 Tax=Candidatus Pantoea communis TaxID=2608354 RepID=A0ABX0RZJ5_9GAMM|nr:hypothetical protein [Pantoea communis]